MCEDEPASEARCPGMVFWWAGQKSSTPACVCGATKAENRFFWETTELGPIRGGNETTIQ